MKKINTLRRILLVGVMAFVLGSCQDDFTTPTGLTGKTIAVTMGADPNFNLWTTAVSRVGFYVSLNNNSSGEFTIFAPSDPAMTAYLTGVYGPAPGTNQLTIPITETSLISFMEGLTTTSAPTLASFVSTVAPVLNYHIVSSKITSTEITGSQTFATLNGARLALSRTSPTIVLLNGGGSAGSGATVTNFDLLGSNGVAHTIDRVMAVPGVANVLATFVPPLTINYTTNPPGLGGGTTSDATDGDFDLLAALIRHTGQIPTILPNSTPLPDFTIFQANDGFIRAYLTATFPAAALTTEIEWYNYIASLVSVTPPASPNPTLAQLTTITQYQIVPGRFLVQDFTNAQVVTTSLTSGTFSVSIAPGPPAVYTLVDVGAGTDPVITTSNILTNSGVLHTINQVLRPN